jgi:hypothetical protein
MDGSNLDVFTSDKTQNYIKHSSTKSYFVLITVRAEVEKNILVSNLRHSAQDVLSLSLLTVVYKLTEEHHVHEMYTSQK